MSTWFLLTEPERPDYLGRTREPHNPYDGKIFKVEKEATMQVTYNGFTGELVKLEREDLRAFGVKDRIYNLSIYDSEHRVTHSFAGVKLEDVKFLSGEVSFK